MKCFYCEREAEYLCDYCFTMGVELEEPLREGDTAADIVRKMEHVRHIDATTCDRPLCPDHCVRVGTIFASGRGGFVDSVDRCPGHANMPDLPDRTARVGGGRAA